ncbi:hypothetical protein [Alkalihalobacterium chitinilyticum]|uniref:Uncharacterized protein n=1 Tax=Alkalihalobacterium chitinilyticum TaxID=2980103 RepID=A0ABT5VL74_9BACI|nr:hypothetical protein [Alkalihalobacterium chitinilyticum]MDE5416179.1 hypothetical protein [Alkalihalobacterium chitinilyticum]
MFRKNESNKNCKAEILMAGQSLSFKLDENESNQLLESLEKVSYDFKKLESIKLYHPDGKLKSVINPI